MSEVYAWRYDAKAIQKDARDWCEVVMEEYGQKRPTKRGKAEDAMQRLKRQRLAPLISSSHGPWLVNPQQPARGLPAVQFSKFVLLPVQSSSQPTPGLLACFLGRGCESFNHSWPCLSNAVQHILVMCTIQNDANDM